MHSSDDVKALFRSGVNKMNEGSFMDAKVDLLVASKMDDKNTNIKKALAKLVRLENAAKAKDRAAAKEHAKDDEIAAVIMASVKGWSDKGSEVPEIVRRGVFNSLLETGISKMNTGSLVEASIDLTAALTLDPRNEDVLKALTKLQGMEVAESKKRNDANDTAKAPIDDDSTNVIVDTGSDQRVEVETKEALIENIRTQNNPALTPETKSTSTKSTVNMVVLHSSYPSAVTQALKILLEDGGIIMFEIAHTSFFMAAPTKAACKKLREIKGEEVDIGFCIGDINNFYSLLEQDSLPPTIKEQPSSFATFTPSHLNCLITKDTSLNTDIVRNGAIEGFITKDGSPMRTFFSEIEAGLKGYNETALLGGKHYSAPIIVSANNHRKGINGDWNEAKAFGREHNIPLGVRFESIGNRNGKPFSVFQLRSEIICALRKGEMYKDIEEREELRQARAEFAKHVLDALDFISGDISITGLYKMFKSIDGDGNGFLDRIEFQRLLVRLYDQRFQGRKERKAGNSTVSSGSKYNSKRSISSMSIPSTMRSGENKPQASENSPMKLQSIDSSALFDAIDFNGDDKISFLEFIRFLEDAHEYGMSPQMQVLENKFMRFFRRKVDSILGSDDGVYFLDQFMHVFNAMDLDKDGSISNEELFSFLTSGDLPDDEVPLSYLEVNVLFAFLDADDSSSLTFDDIFNYLDRCNKENTLEKKAAALFEKKRFKKAAKIFQAAAGYSGGDNAVQFVPKGDDVDMKIRCLINAAVCHIKEMEWIAALNSANAVLGVSGFDRDLKALYCRGLANLNMGFLDDAKDDLMVVYYADNSDADVRNAISKLKEMDGVIPSENERKEHNASRDFVRKDIVEVDVDEENFNTLHTNAMTKIDKGDLDGAHSDLMKAFNLDSSDARVRKDLAMLKEIQAAAQKERIHPNATEDAKYRGSLEDNQYSSERWNKLCDIYDRGIEKMEQGFLTEAKQALVEAFHIDSQNARVRKALAKIKGMEESSFDYDAGRAKSSEYIDSSIGNEINSDQLAEKYQLYSDGIAKMNQGGLDEARIDLMAALEIDWNDMDLRRDIAKVKDMKRQYISLTYDDTNDDIMLYTSTMRKYYDTGIFKLNEGFYDEAKENLVKAFTLDTKSEKVRNALAMVKKLQSGNDAGTKSDLENQMKEGNFSSRQKMVERMNLDHDEDDVKVIHDRGVIKMNQGDLEGARAYLIAALDRDWANLNVRRDLAKLKEMEAAILKENGVDLKQSTNDNIISHTVAMRELYDGGIMKLSEGSHIEAKADLIKAFKLDSKNPRVRKALAEMKEKEEVAFQKETFYWGVHGDMDQSRRTTTNRRQKNKDGIIIDEEDGENSLIVLHNSGVTKMNEGALDEARADLVKALEISRDDLDIRWALKVLKERKNIALKNQKIAERENNTITVCLTEESLGDQIRANELLDEGIKKMSQGNFVEAKVDLVAAFKLDNKNRRIRKALGMLKETDVSSLNKSWPINESLHENDRILGSESRQEEVSALLISANNKMNKGVLKGAKADLISALNLDGSDLEVRREFAKLKEMDVGALRGAKDDYIENSNTPGEDASKARILCDSGAVKMNNGSLSAAREDLISAFQLDTKNQNVREALARLKQLENYAKGELEIKQSSAHFGRNAGSNPNASGNTLISNSTLSESDILYISGLAKLNEGALTAAKADLIAAYKLNSKNLDVKNALKNLKGKELSARKEEALLARAIHI